MHKFDEKLHIVLQKVADRSSKDGPLLCVFDLDSTLFNVTQRSQRIVRDLVENPEFQKLFPSFIESLSQVEIEHDEWGIKEAVLRAGVEDLEAQKFIRKYWSKHFFSNEYLRYDFPYIGAVEFVKDLYQRGAEISYLTGRDQVRMKKGTISSLKQWEFPIEMDRTSLFMKPDKEIKDHLYKTEVFGQILENRPHLEEDHVWFFENEPVIIKAVEEIYPKIQVVFMDSVHSGREISPSHLPSLKMKYHK